MKTKTTDPWGRGRTTNHTSQTCRIPFTHHRNPGQVEDVALGLVENGYRVMVPELGQYTGADPLHQAQTMTSWGPQAYTYAGGVPTVNVDEDGRYYLDGSWDPHPGTKAIVQRAFDDMKADIICKCAFKVGYGREPFNDPFGIHYGISSFAPPASPGSETHGFSPFMYLHHNGQSPNLQQYLPELGSTFARIELSNATLVQGSREIRDTLAHEMVHTSFNEPSESSSWPSPVSVGRYCAGGVSTAFMSREMKSCCSGCGL